MVTIPAWQYIISMSVYVLLLLFIVEVMRKKYKFAAIFWILSILTFPLWSNYVDGWFRWAKTLSVLVPTALVVGIARIAQFEKKEGWWSFFRKDWVLWFLYAILGLNILEASLKDFALGNIPNGIAGLILIVTIPLFKTKGRKKRGWKISSEKPGDLIAYTDPLWNFLYTTWNMAFVYAESPAFAASSFCILLAAELYPIIKRRPELYVTARVYTLATHILIRATYESVFPRYMNSESWYNPIVVKYWGMINLLITIPYIFWYFWKKNKEKKMELEEASN